MTDSALAELRPGLLRFCRRLRLDPADAEDLAQEAILIGLRQVREGKVVADWAPWLAGIARRLALKTPRRTEELSEALVSGDDPLDGLLSRERESLLELAWRQLDTTTQELLTARFLDDTPVFELAARLRLSENTTSRRLGRAREALEKVLQTHHPDAAAAHGLLTPTQADGWTQTPLCCPRCTKLMDGRLDSGSLALRCPDCDKQGGLYGLSTDAHPLDGVHVLAGARGFRVATKRVNAWWESYLKVGLHTGRVRCRGCGRPVALETRTPRGNPGVYTGCVCGEPLFVHPAGLLLHSEIGQNFWREQGKIRFIEPRWIVCGGRDAILVAFESPVSSARVEAVYALDDLTCLTSKNNS